PSGNVLNRRVPSDLMSDLTAVTGKGEARWRDLRRAHLLEAASRVFAQLGYDGAAIDDIAREAGIGKPTLYRYFSSKAALFEAVFVEALDDLEAKLEDVIAAGGSFAAQITRMVEAMV